MPATRGYARGRPARRATAAILPAALLPAALLVAAGGQPAAGHPLAPVSLLVDEQPRPLDVTGTPEFGWLPRDTGGDEIQAGYEIRVTDALSRRPLWDSGEVRSAQEASVPYRGPALADGRAYQWTVRTWNREDKQGGYAQPATFDTGIGDSEWSGAEWIRRATTGNDSVIDYTLARDQFTLNDHSPVARARVYISAEGQWQLHVNGGIVDTQDNYQSPGESYYDVEDITSYARQAQRARGPAGSTASRAAGSTGAGQLAIGVKYGAWPATEGNGRPEGPVPRRSTLTAPAAAGATSVTVASATGYGAGENLALGTPGAPGFEVATISAISGAVITFRSGLSNAQPAGTAVASENGPTGLLVKVVVDHADGAAETFVSSGDWQVTKDTGEVNSVAQRRTGQDAGTYIEYLDAGQALTGWDQVNYAYTSAWAGATVLGTAPLAEPSSCSNYLSGSSPCGFSHLVPQQSSLAYQVVHPVSVTTLPADGSVIADFGTDLIGVPAVRFGHGTAGQQVTLTGSYRLDHSTLAAATAPGATTIEVTSVAGFQPGDPVTVDAPADGYGAGDPQTDTVAAVGTAGAAGTGITLRAPLRRAHASGVWVQGSRAGTSALDTQGTNLTFYDTQSSGPQTTDFYVAEGFRYLQITNAGERLTPPEIWVVAQHEDAPAGHAATFRSSDPTLDAVFGLMRRSALQAGQMEFQDSPDRQAGQFLGDAVDESLATTSSLDERALTREAIGNFIFSQQRYWLSAPPGPGSQYGDLNATYPTGDGKRDIPDYAEMFPEWVWDYYLESGDTATLARAYPTIRNVASYVTDSIATSGPAAGLVYQLAGGTSSAYRYGIIDWPPTDRYDTTVLNAGADTVVNMRAAEVFRAAADAARVLGDTAGAATYTTDTAALIQAINTRLIEPGGLYDDGLTPAAGNPQIGNASEHDQSFAVAYGVAPPSSLPALGAYIAGQGMKQGAMDLGQLEQALIGTGQSGALVSLLTNPAADGPAKILAEGGTTMWEQWDPGCGAPGGAPGDSTASCVGTGISQGSSDSFSHGWGSVGITGILDGLLGITVTAPAATTVQIAPPASGLAHADGTEWTESGPVHVAWTRTGTGVTLDVDVPDNVRATIVLPGPDLPGPDLAGTARYAATGPGAPRFLGTQAMRERQGGQSLFSTGSGHSHFALSSA